MKGAAKNSRMFLSALPLAAAFGLGRFGSRRQGQHLRRGRGQGVARAVFDHLGRQRLVHEAR